MKLQSWKTYVSYHELDRFPILKDFSDEISGDLNECEFLILYINICKTCITLN